MCRKQKKTIFDLPGRIKDNSNLQYFIIISEMSTEFLLLTINTECHFQNEIQHTRKKGLVGFLAYQPL